MQKSVLMSFLLIACSGEQGFGQGKSSPAASGGAGIIEVFPEEVVWNRVVIGNPDSEGFRISSVGESPLKVTLVTLSDAGQTQADADSAPEAVFYEIRPFEPEKHTVPFDLDPGESAEFVVMARFLAPGTTTGQVRIRSNDTEAEGPAPGDFRLPLSATGVEPSGGGDDTGEPPADDTGDEPADDTGD